VEYGWGGTLAARNQGGAFPLHILCGSTNPSLRTVQYLIQSSSCVVTARTTHDGQYPFMIAAGEIVETNITNKEWYNTYLFIY
jgi:hypothetical protein